MINFRLRFRNVVTITACLAVIMLASCINEYDKAFQLSFVSEGGIKIKRRSLEYTGQDKLLTYNVQGEKWNKSFIPKQYISKKPEDLGGIVIVSKSKFKTLAQYVKENQYGQDLNIKYNIEQEYFTIKIFDPYKMKVVQSKKFEAEDMYHGRYPVKTERVRTFYVDKDEVTLWITHVWNLYLQGTTEEKKLVGTWGKRDNTSHSFWTFGDNGHFAYSEVLYIESSKKRDEYFVKGKFLVNGNVIEFYESKYDRDSGFSSTFRYFDTLLYNVFPSDTLLTTPLKTPYKLGDFSVKLWFIGDNRLRIVSDNRISGTYVKEFEYMD